MPSPGVDRLLAFGESSALAAHNFGDGGEHFRKIEDLVAVLSVEMAAGTRRSWSKGHASCAWNALSMRCWPTARRNPRRTLMLLTADAGWRKMCAVSTCSITSRYRTGAGGHDGVGDFVCCRTGVIRWLAAKNRAGRASGWSADAPRQDRDTDDGRRADPDRHWCHDALVG